MIELQVILGVVIFGFIALSVQLHWRCKVLQGQLDLYSSHILTKVNELEKNNNTLGKVMKIFEEETQILRRRSEKTAVKDRFHRTPR
jgi:hypothetical protein